MNHWKRLRSSFALAVLVSLSAKNVLAIVIDDFSVGPVSLSAQTTWVTQIQTGLDPNVVVGGSRYMSIRSTGGPIGSQLEIDPAEGELRFSSDPDAFGYLMLTYGEEQPLGLDLTEDGDDRLVMSFSEVLNTGPGSRFPSSLTVWSGTGDGEVRRHYNLTGVNEPGNLVIPFGYFDPVDFTNVSKITLIASRYFPGSRFTLTQIMTIPEPTAIGLTAVGAWCLVVGAARRRGRPKQGMY